MTAPRFFMRPTQAIPPHKCSSLSKFQLSRSSLLFCGSQLCCCVMKLMPLVIRTFIIHMPQQRRVCAGNISVLPHAGVEFTHCTTRHAYGRHQGSVVRVIVHRDNSFDAESLTRKPRGPQPFFQSANEAYFPENIQGTSNPLFAMSSLIIVSRTPAKHR